MIVLDLGQVSAIKISPTAPTNTKLLWYDLLQSGSVKIKVFDEVNNVWRLITDYSNSVLKQDLVVSLPNNQTIGKFKSGDSISAGLNALEILIEAAQAPINPTINLTSSTVVQFNQTSINNILNFTKIINSLGATVASVLLEYRRNNTGVWQTLSTNTNINTFTHILTDSNFNTQPFNYRYTVIDSKGGSNSSILNITPVAYQAPTRPSPIANVTKEIGDISSSLSSYIQKNSPYVDLISYRLQYQLNNGTWINIGNSVNFLDPSNNLIALTDSSAPINTKILSYRILIVDSFTTNYTAVGTINLNQKQLYGYNIKTSLTLTELLSLNLINYTSNKNSVITATSINGTFTFYGYDSISGDLTSIIKDGTTPDLGAWTKLTNLTGVNSFGATVSYIVYKTNSTNAYTNNVLIIS